MKRILLKLSGEALSGDKGFGFDEATVVKVAGQVKALIDDGTAAEISNKWFGKDIVVFEATYEE